MSRRRDRERFEAMKHLDPDYRGFRGHENEPSRRGKTPLEPVVCVSCGRKRNVARGVAVEQRDNYVCSRCADNAEAQEAVETERTS